MPRQSTGSSILRSAAARLDAAQPAGTVVNETDAASGFFSTNLTILLVIGALIGFWIVGAYNRLVRLRSAINAAFGALDAQIRQRHDLLLRWIAEAQVLFDDSQHLVDAISTVAAQVIAASDTVRKRPSAQPGVAELRTAEAGLALARSKLLAELPAHLNQPSLSSESADLQALGEQILAVESTLNFARQQFNAAADEYNLALTEFPTTLITGPFGFHAAGNL